MTPPLEPVAADAAPTLPLFGYGTLQPGEARWFALDGRTVGARRPDGVPGRLYHTGWGYPAWVPDDDGDVTGVVLRLAEETAAQTWALLCEIEGGVEGDDAPVGTVTGAGRRVLACPHRGTGPLPASFRRIAA